MSRQEELIKDLPLATQEAIKRYPRFPERRVGFIDGYQYAVEKACEWLERNAYLYVNDIDQINESALIGDFRGVMEE